jgi:cytochrome b561
MQVKCFIASPDSIARRLSMHLRDTAQSYSSVTKLLHWVMAVLVVVCWMLGVSTDDLPKGVSRTVTLFAHITVGLILLDVLVLRAVWRAMSSPPPVERQVFGIWPGMGRLMHYLLYAMLLMVPVTGIMLQFFYGKSLPLYGVAEISSPVEFNATFASVMMQVHELSAHSLLALAAAHALAALVHHYVFRDRTLVRMLPRSDGS